MTTREGGCKSTFVDVTHVYNSMVSSSFEDMDMGMTKLDLFGIYILFVVRDGQQSVKMP